MMIAEIFTQDLVENEPSAAKIELREARKVFGDLEAIAPLSFEVGKGEFLAILGPSGCGKSTLLSMIAGVERPISGELLVDGRPVSGPDRSRAFVFQEDGLLPWRTVAGNVALGLEYGKVPERERREAVERILETVGLDGFAEYYPHRLSGGMRQRVSLARSFVMNPDILLMDEPFGALDAITRLKMHRDLLRTREGSGTTVVMVTHDVDEALYLADRVIVLSERPARLLSDTKIGLPRPRDRANARYAELRRSFLRDLGLE